MEAVQTDELKHLAFCNAKDNIRQLGALKYGRFVTEFRLGYPEKTFVWSNLTGTMHTCPWSLRQCRDGRTADSSVPDFECSYSLKEAFLS